MLLLSTSSLTWYGLHKIFLFAKQASYDWIDLELIFSNYDFWDADYINSLIKEFNLPVLSITAPDKGLNTKKVDEIIKLALDIKAQNITFAPPNITDKDKDWYGNLIKIKKQYSISISIKNIEAKFMFFIIPEFKNASISEIKKITWDTALDISAVDTSSWMDITKIQKLLWVSMKNIYLSDRLLEKKYLLPWKLDWLSNLPLESFLMRLKANYYNSFITLKVNPKELSVWTNDVLLDKLNKFKLYLEKYIK